MCIICSKRASYGPLAIQVESSEESSELEHLDGCTQLGMRVG